MRNTKSENIVRADVIKVALAGLAVGLSWLVLTLIGAIIFKSQEPARDMSVALGQIIDESVVGIGIPFAVGALILRLLQIKRPLLIAGLSVIFMLLGKAVLVPINDDMGVLLLAMQDLPSATISFLASYYISKRYRTYAELSKALLIMMTFILATLFLIAIIADLP